MNFLLLTPPFKVSSSLRFSSTSFHLHPIHTHFNNAFLFSLLVPFCSCPCSDVLLRPVLGCPARRSAALGALKRRQDLHPEQRFGLHLRLHQPAQALRLPLETLAFQLPGVNVAEMVIQVWNLTTSSAGDILISWLGPTVCPSGWKCVYSNDWYSQCLQQ